MSFVDLPLDVLALVFVEVLSVRQESANPRGPKPSLLLLQEDKAAAIKAFSRWHKLANICKRAHQAAMRDPVVKQMLQNAHFFVPSHLWAGGTYFSAFRVQMEVLNENIVQQKLQDLARSKPRPMV